MGLYDGFISSVLSDEKLAEIGAVSVGSQSFQVLVTPLLSLREVLSAANNVDRYLTEIVKTNINQKISELTNFLVEIINFDAAKVQEPGRRSGQLIEAVKTTCDFIISSALPAIAMTPKNLDLAQLKNEGEEIVQNLKEIQGIERAIQGFDATKHASTYFQTKADKHRKSSRFYLALLFVLLLITMVLTKRWHPVGTGSVSSRIASELPGLNMLALAWYAIRLLARNLRNSQHLAEVNESKATILKAGEKFGASVGEDAIKVHIFETVVDSTLTLGDTGYFNKDHDSPSIANTGIPFIVKSVTSKD